MLVEKWLAAKGKNVVSNQVAAWRRAHMSDLTNVFDFSSPDFSIPSLPTAPAPHKNAQGQYDGSSYCEAQYVVLRPPVPYGQQSSDVASLSEKGFKSVRGALTEGRYLTFESNGYALTNPGSGASHYTSTKDTADHSAMSQRWVVHQLAGGGDSFIIRSALDGRFLGNGTSLRDSSAAAEQYAIQYLGNGVRYSLMQQSGMYLGIEATGELLIAGAVDGFQVFSVT